MYYIKLYNGSRLIQTLSYPDEGARANDALRVAHEWAGQADKWMFDRDNIGPKFSLHHPYR